MGPVQLIAFGFDRPKFGGGISAELNRLREKDIVRVIDALVIQKTASGEIKQVQTSDLTIDQVEQFGAILGGLVGLGSGGEQGMVKGAETGKEAIRDRGGHVFDTYETWDALEDMPADSAAAIILLEHRWAIPLRDAIQAEGGAAVGDLWVHPEDLVAVGLLAREVAEQNIA
jgi:uncharacterized membrane protein